MATQPDAPLANEYEVPAPLDEPSPAIRVTTGARLHFGLVAPRPGRGPAFGGCGMMIDGPGCDIVVRRSERDETHCDVDVREVVERIRDRRRTSRGEDAAWRIDVRRVTSRHAGLGSGTQLALAVAAAMCGTTSMPTVDQLVEATGRGRRSAIGIHGFRRGGFLVDAGKGDGDRIGELADHVTVPAEWRILLVTPRTVLGTFGNEEREAFAALPETTASLSERMRQRIDEELLPTLRTSNFDGFSAAVREYGRDAGRAFAPVQGGELFSHAESAAVVAWFEARGIRGVGQTSWGPTVFAFVPDDDAARIVANEFAGDSLAAEAELRIARPRNDGASITFDDAPSTAGA